MVTHQQRVLFGRRKIVGGDFVWQLPGGWIEPGESPQQAARREVNEETGLLLLEMHFVGITSNVFSPRDHSISLFFEAECAQAGSLKTFESDKCGDWEWKFWTEISENLYLPLRQFKETDYRPFMLEKQATHVSF